MVDTRAGRLKKKLERKKARKQSRASVAPGAIRYELRPRRGCKNLGEVEAKVNGSCCKENEGGAVPADEKNSTSSIVVTIRDSEGTKLSALRPTGRRGCKNIGKVAAKVDGGCKKAVQADEKNGSIVTVGNLEEETKLSAAAGVCVEPTGSSIVTTAKEEELQATTGRDHKPSYQWGPPMDLVVGRKWVNQPKTRGAVASRPTIRGEIGSKVYIVGSSSEEMNDVPKPPSYLRKNYPRAVVVGESMFHKSKFGHLSRKVQLQCTKTGKRWYVDEDSIEWVTDVRTKSKEEKGKDT